MANEILTEILLDLRNTKKQLKTVEKSGVKTAKKVGKGIGSSIENGFSRSFSGISRRIIGLAAAFAAAFGSRAILRAANQQEKAVATLNQALKQTGEFTEAVSLSTQQYAADLQKLTGVGDELILQNVALAQSFTKNITQAKELTRVAIDFAAAADINVTEAVRRLGRATQGSAADISNFDSRIRSLTKSELLAGKATKLLGQTFAGAAAGQLKTFEGATLGLSNAFGDFLEGIGRFVTQNPLFLSVINRTTKLFSGLSESLANVHIESFNIELAKMKGIFLGIFATGELIFNMFAALGEIIGGLAAIISLSVGREMEAAKFAVTDLKDFIEDLDLLDFESTLQVSNFVDRLAQGLNENKQTINQQGLDLGNTFGSGFLDGFSDVSAAIGAVFEDMVARTRPRLDSIRTDLRVKLTGAVKTFAVGVSGAFASIGASLVNGTDVFEAFGKAILSVFGDLAMQLGAFYWAMGIANLYLNPPAAATQLAGGAALIGIGGALKALSGTMGGGGAPQATSLPSSGAGGTLQADVSGDGGGGGFLEQPETAQSEQRVVVNIQGNVLDRRETGIEIAEVIAEAFATNGVRIVEA